MSHKETDSIYVDLCELRKEVRKASYLMEAKSRILYVDDTQKEIAECIRLFVRARKQHSQQDALPYMERLDEEFAVVKVDLRIMDDEHIWRGKKDENGNVKCVFAIFDRVAKVDEGLSRWGNALRKGRAVSEL